MPHGEAVSSVSSRRLTVVGLCLLLAASTGCARGAKAEKASDSAAASPAQSAPAGGGNEAPAVSPMLALGYRPDWRGYPQVDAKAGIKFLDVLGDVVAVHDGRNILTAMEPGSGKNRWSLDLGSPLMKFVGNARSGDMLYACSQSEIQVLDVRTGQIKARQRLASLANTRPVLSGSVAVFGSSTGEVLGHNLFTGYKQWAYKLGGTVRADPVITGETTEEGTRSVAVVSQTGDVIILDPRTGESFGRRRSIFDGLENNPAANDSSVFIAGTDQSVWSVSDDGRLNWRVRTPDRLTGQPAVHENSVIVDVPSTGLTAFDTGSGAKQWTAKGVSGEVIAVRKGRLVVWDRVNKAMLTLDAARGDVVDRAPASDVTIVAVDAFVDGNLYVGRGDGSVEKFSPR
ncbi:MAG: PQQ-binding-like beta-propeller repeat protein [Phycisphaerales bacterium]